MFFLFEAERGQAKLLQCIDSKLNDSVKLSHSGPYNCTANTLSDSIRYYRFSTLQPPSGHDHSCHQSLESPRRAVTHKFSLSHDENRERLSPQDCSVKWKSESNVVIGGAHVPEDNGYLRAVQRKIWIQSPLEKPRMVPSNRIYAKKEQANLGKNRFHMALSDITLPEKSESHQHCITLLCKPQTSEESPICKKAEAVLELSEHDLRRIWNIFTMNHEEEHLRMGESIVRTFEKNNYSHCFETAAEATFDRKGYDPKKKLILPDHVRNYRKDSSWSTSVEKENFNKRYAMNTLSVPTKRMSSISNKCVLIRK